MERFKILKVKKMGDSWVAVNIKDLKNNFTFWLDCGVMDGYGNRENFKTEDLYIDWEFNQYIFHLDNTKDLEAKEWQENPDNIDDLQDFIDDKNDELLKYFDGVIVCKK